MALQVIFDMDGVLFDTERLCLRVWRELAPDYGVTPEQITAVFWDCVGTTSARTREIVLAACGADFPWDDYQARSSRRFHAIAVAEGLPQMPGAKDLLRYLRESGARLGLASSTRRAVVEQELRDAGFYDYFDVIAGGDQVRRSKPEPDIYLLACGMLDVAPDRTFAIEDSHNGVRAAHRAGMRPVMVPDLLPVTPEMERLCAAILPDLHAVRTWLEARV